jgi:UPF0716 protein FxsA
MPLCKSGAAQIEALCHLLNQCTVRKLRNSLRFVRLGHDFGLDEPKSRVWHPATMALRYHLSWRRNMVHPIRLAAVLAFLAFPILEIGLLIRAGQWLGFWKLTLLVVATALLGSAVIRRTGFAVLTKARQQLDTGDRGFNPLLDGLLQITAGLLLIFPGIISDAIGLILLVPAVRTALITYVLPRFFAVTAFSTAEETIFRPSPQTDGARDADGPFDANRDATMAAGVTIEGEYERVSEATVSDRRDVATNPPRRAWK